MKIKLLVGCEHSGVVTNAFRMQGIEAYSCDLKPGYIPQWHHQGDLFEVYDKLQPNMVIAHPPCTYLARAAQYRAQEEGRPEEMLKSLDFVKKIWSLPCERVVIENPLGLLSTHWQMPTQTVYPWQWGDNFSKDIALWIRGLRPLKPEINEQPTKLRTVANRVNSRMSKEKKREIKSLFFPGIAEAMAKQWGQPGDELGTSWGQPGEDRGRNLGGTRDKPASGATEINANVWW